jgi:hypothetical protein
MRLWGRLLSQLIEIGQLLNRNDSKSVETRQWRAFFFYYHPFQTSIVGDDNALDSLYLTQDTPTYFTYGTRYLV